jgi:hypothetical protein
MLVVLGDSHIHGFRGIAGYIGMIPGATAYGLANENSRTQAGNKFRSVMEKLGTKHIYLFHLGEVDCSSLSWKKQKEGIVEVIVQSCLNYIRFIRTLTGYRLIIASCPPTPVISYLGSKGNRTSNGSVWEVRTDLINRFNLMMEAFCLGANIRFYNYHKDVCKNGIVLDNFKLPNASNPHLNPQELHKVFSKSLKYRSAKTVLEFL